MKLPHKRIKSRIQQKAKSMALAINELSESLQEKCVILKAKIENYKNKNRGSLAFELKKEVASLIEEAGHHRPIALLLGISEKVIAGWGYYYNSRNDIADIFQ